MNKNLAVLKPVTAGTPLMDALTVARINAIQDAIKQLWSGENLRSGGNMQIVPSANGPTINSLALGGDNISNIIGGGSEAFDVKVEPIIGGGYRLKVMPGTINGLLPTNYDIEYTTATDCFLLLSMTTLNGEVASATLSFGTEVAPVITSQASMPPPEFSYTLGMLVAGTWYKTVGGSLTAVPVEVFRVAKTEYTPGSLPYEPYYSWSISG